jgi:hypothetical protein
MRAIVLCCLVSVSVAACSRPAEIRKAAAACSWDIRKHFPEIQSKVMLEPAPYIGLMRDCMEAHGYLVDDKVCPEMQEHFSEAFDEKCYRLDF